MNNISKFLVVSMLAIPVVFGFGNQTKKAIDEITNNTGTDILLNPTDKVDINYFTGSKALQSTADGELEESTTTSTQLGYLNTTTSDVQVQIDSKTPLTRLLNTTAPLQGGGDLTADRTLTIDQSNTTTDGYLSSTDWNTFNGKQDALTFGDLTESTSNILTITGGTGAVIGSGSSIEVQQATNLVDGFLSSTDWNTFNNKSEYASPLTTNGDVLFYNTGAEQRLPIGSTDEVLKVGASGLPEWGTVTSVSVTTKGDLQTYSTTPDRLPVGTDGQILSANSSTSTGLEWIANNPSPLTTKGDLFTYDTDNQRLAVGTDGQILQANSATATGLEWVTGSFVDVTTKGDIQIHNGTNSTRLPVGTNGQILVADSAETNGLKWQDSVVNISQAHFVGYLKWSVTTNCLWSDSTSAYDVFADDADCDDNSRTVFGDVTDPTNGLKPHIGLTNVRTNGTYRITYLTNFYKAQTSSNTCKYRLVGDETTSNGNVGSSNGINISPSMVFQTRFTSGGNKELEMHVSSENNTDNCHIDLRGSTLDISVEFFPDSSSTAVVQNTELDATTANEFSAKISSTGVVSDENYDFITSNCDNTVTGIYKCTIPSGLFTTKPNCVATPKFRSKQAGYDYGSSSLTELWFGTTTLDGIAENNDFTVQCSKTGADVNKSQTIVGTFENINSSDLYKAYYYRDASKIITSGSLQTIEYDTKVPNTNGYNNDNLAYDTSTGIFTAHKDSSFKICATAIFTTAVWNVGNIREFVLTVSNGKTIVLSREEITTTNSDYYFQQACETVSMAKNETARVQISQNTGADKNIFVSSGAIFNRLSIEEQPDYEAIVKNLYNEKEECQTKHLSSDVTGNGAIASLAINSLESGKKYEFNARMYAQNGTNAEDNIIITFTHNGSQLFQLNNGNYDGGANPMNMMAYTSYKFVASDTTITAASSSVGSGSTIFGDGGTTVETFVEICELPDSTIINSTKCD
jgi:hypothetical protein